MALKFPNIIIAWLVILAPALALTYTIENNILKFSHYPIYDVHLIYKDIWDAQRTYIGVIKSDRTGVKDVISISYDNSTFLILDPIQNKTNERYITITGKTEDSSMCEEAKQSNPSTYWDDPEHCYTKVTAYVNGKESKSVFANPDGTFELVVGLEPGKNKIRVVARDPSWNQAEETLKTQWNPDAWGTFLYNLDTRPELKAVATLLVFIAFLGAGVYLAESIYGKKKKEELENRLAQAFIEEGHIIERVGPQKLLESSDIRTKIRQVLILEPFSGLVGKCVSDIVKEYKSRKAKGQPTQGLVDEYFARPQVRKAWQSLIFQYDPNAKSLGNNAFVLESAYLNTAKELVKEKAKEKLGLNNPK